MIFVGFSGFIKKDIDFGWYLEIELSSEASNNFFWSCDVIKVKCLFSLLSRNRQNLGHFSFNLKMPKILSKTCSREKISNKIFSGLSNVYIERVSWNHDGKLKCVWDVWISRIKNATKIQDLQDFGVVIWCLPYGAWIRSTLLKSVFEL